MWTANAALVSNISGIVYTMLNQHILPIVTSKSSALGGNSLGLDPSDGPLVMILLSITWDSASDDATVMSTANALIDEIEAAAKVNGLYHAFKYLNYANAGQDVFDGYGPANRVHLQAVSKRYDPTGVFQRAVPGGFKLFEEACCAHDSPSATELKRWPNWSKVWA